MLAPMVIRTSPWYTFTFTFSLVIDLFLAWDKENSMTCARIWTEDLVIIELIYLCTELQITCPWIGSSVTKCSLQFIVLCINTLRTMHQLCFVIFPLEHQWDFLYNFFCFHKALQYMFRILDVQVYPTLTFFFLKVVLCQLVLCWPSHPPTCMYMMLNQLIILMWFETNTQLSWLYKTFFQSINTCMWNARFWLPRMCHACDFAITCSDYAEEDLFDS